MMLLEVFAVIFAIAYLLLAVRQNILCWYAAFLSTSIYIYLYWDVSLYMESILNIYYLLMAIYGWINWSNRKEKINLSMALLTKKNCYLVRNTISKYCNKKITFKKPNDLLIDKKKICGILQEKIEKSKKEYLIVGIGINLIKSPNIPNYPTSNLLNFTNRKMNKKKFEQDLKISFENFLSKYYKAS